MLVVWSEVNVKPVRQHGDQSFHSSVFSAHTVEIHQGADNIAPLIQSENDYVGRISVRRNGHFDYILTQPPRQSLRLQDFFKCEPTVAWVSGLFFVKGRGHRCGRREHAKASLRVGLNCDERHDCVFFSVRKTYIIVAYLHVHAHFFSASPLRVSSPFAS